MTTRRSTLNDHGNAYNIFILVLTLYSLAIVVLLLLPIPQPVRDLLNVYDNVVCLIFLGDFVYNLLGSHPRSAYFIGARGWLDLLGSVPSLGFFQLTGLLRLARLSRLVRIARILSGENRRALVRDVLKNRGEYATFITILAAGIVLSTASVLVLQFESGSPDANIKTGGDALWWGLVTITTVGYGDRFPITFLGRTTGLFVMLAGVGIIGALASILASLLVPSPETETDAAASAEGEGMTAARPSGPAEAGATPVPPSDPGAAGTEAILARIADLQAEVAGLRAEMAEGRESGRA
jgi:voltage-gated potassium channel